MIYENKVQTLLNNADYNIDAHTFMNRMLTYSSAFGLGIFLVLFNFNRQLAAALGIFIVILFQIVVYAWLVLRSNKRINEIEDILPDFLALMSSNIRSGLTPDRALLLSSRKEFGPLAKEIDRAAKEAIAGKPFTEALMDMTKRVQSETFAKTIRLIVEGVRSGGNLSELLENTALDIRRFKSMRKEVSATVLVYQLFVFASAGFGAPVLYAVATFLVETIAQFKENINIDKDVLAAMPLIGGTTNIDAGLVFLFAVSAIGITSFFASITAGVIGKGKESDGIVYIPILIFLSYLIFFSTKILLEISLKGLFYI